MEFLKAVGLPSNEYADADLEGGAGMILCLNIDIIY